MSTRKLIAISLLLLIISISAFGQNSVLNQQVAISNTISNSYDLINYLQQQTEYSINYSESVVKVAKEIKLQASSYSVKYLLDKIFSPQKVDYIVKQKKILVRPASLRSSGTASIKQSFISLKGKVIEKETLKAVTFANISLKNQAIGTVSNSDGGFVFHIPAKYKNDSLIVSCIGYKSFVARLNDLQTKKLKIQLEKKVYDLSEVKVKPKDPREIVAEAIARIPENYPQKPINMDAFYREMTFENDTCVQMAEAVAKIYYRPYGEKYDWKEAFSSFYSGFKRLYNEYYDNPFSYAGPINSKDEFHLSQIRCSKLNNNHRFKVIPLGSIYSLLWHDYLKRRLPYGNDKFLKKHKLKLLDIVQINGRTAYKIYSKPKPYFKIYRDIWYVDVNSYAIISVESILLEWRFKTNKYWTPALYNKKKRKCKDTEYSKVFKTSIKYKLLENKWVVNEVKHQGVFEHIFSKHYKHLETEEKICYEIFAELYIKEVEQKKVVRIPDSLQCKNIVAATLYEDTSSYDKNFWEYFKTMPLNSFQDSAIMQLENFEPLEQQFANRIKKNDSLPPPITKKQTFLNPNTQLNDDYYWLQKPKNIEVLNYIEAENAYTKNHRLGLKQNERNLYSEMIKREKKDTSTQKVKKKVADYEYYYKKSRYLDIDNIYRKKTGSTEEELVLDIAKKTRFHPNYWVDITAISPDNKFIAYTEPVTDGYDSRVVFKNMETGQKVDSIDKIGQIAWLKDNKSILYVTWDDANNDKGVFLHKLGTNRKKDKAIYLNNKKNTLLINQYNNKYITLNISNDFYDNAIFRIKQNGKETELEEITQQVRGYAHYTSVQNDTLYSLSKEPKGKTALYKCPMQNPNIKNWQKITENQGNTFFSGFKVFKNFVALLETEDMKTWIKIIDKNGQLIKTLKFNKEETYTIGFEIKDSLPANTFRYYYTSLTTPKKIFEYNIKKNQTTFIRQNQPIGYDAKKYKTKLLWATSKDGTKVPLSIVYNKKRVKRNGKSPVLLYAYGSYGASQNPKFSSTRLSLLDRGFIYAIAHIRGGQELGKLWHENAMQLQKKNTFFDYIACAEELIKQKYTAKGKIIARGGSAGGLTMGAVANMHPELFNTVILEAPYLDVLTSLSDTTAKFCFGERVQLGNPEKKPFYDYIKSYSPYNNIKAQGYPNMLFTAGLLDTRVEYWNALKSVAKLRALKTDKNKLLLKTELYAGHNGYVGRYDSYAYEAFVCAFILDNLGVKY